MALPQIIVIANPEGNWTIFQSFKWIGRFTEVEIPAGMITDFASIPRAFWPVLPPYGKHSLAAIVHDCLYLTRGMEGRFSRYQCDLEFEFAMRLSEVNPVKRAIMFRAVRMFSTARWDEVGGQNTPK